MEKNERIQAETDNLLEVFSSLPADQLALIDGLINEAASMKVELEFLREDLRTNGYWEMFSQSERLDPYERERPAARLYNSMNRNYQSIIKQLAEHLPDGSGSGTDEIMAFIKGPA